MEEKKRSAKKPLVDTKIYLSEKTLNILSIVSEKKEISRNSLIRQIISEWVEKNQDEIKNAQTKNSLF